MSNAYRHRPSALMVRIIAVAVLLGTAADVLFRDAAPGVNFAIWTASFFTGASVLGSVSNRSTVTRRILAPLVLVLAAMVAWRDSPFLRMWNIAAVLAGSMLMLADTRGLVLTSSRIGRYVESLLGASVAVVSGSWHLLNRSLHAFNRPILDTHRRLRSIVLGLGLAVGPIVVFGALFTAADPVFARVAETILDWTWDPSTIASHVTFVGLVAWPVGGYLLGQLRPEPHLALARLAPPSVGILEVGIALRATISICGLFVGIQARYLFGGHELIAGTIGLTYADYARRGFFEIVAAAALVVPLLLTADWLLDRPTPVVAHRFRLLAWALLALVAGMMVSALQRMRLYVEAYGLTESRLYATAFLVWIAAVLAWLAATVLRGNRERFLWGALVAGFGILVGLNLLNVDATIARTNLERHSSAVFDIRYLETLSADGIPTLVAALPHLDDARRCLVIDWLADRLDASNHRDWRAWNWGRYRARRAASAILHHPADLCRAPTAQPRN